MNKDPGTCPRCNEHEMMTPLEVNALSRTTRGEDDDPVWVCSDCGLDEALMDTFLDGATAQVHWPISARSFQTHITDIRMQTSNWNV